MLPTNQTYLININTLKEMLLKDKVIYGYGVIFLILTKNKNL